MKKRRSQLMSAFRTGASHHRSLPLPSSPAFLAADEPLCVQKGVVE
jgi:hypothetical protein